MDAGLGGKSALITGGSRGIGHAIALALAQEGVDLVIASHEPNPENAEQLRETGVQVVSLTVDVSDEPQVVGMVRDSINALGKIDLYVNNAATALHQPITKITTDAWLKTVHTNLSSCIWSCREVCRHMIERGTGTILIVGSTAQYTQAYGEAAYHISKTGLRVYKNTLALEMAAYGIRVNLLIPGHYPTQLTAGIDENKANILRREIPQRRFGQPSELGTAAILLLSDQLSPYTTGAELSIDGGLHLRPLPMYSDPEIRGFNQD